MIVQANLQKQITEDSNNNNINDNYQIHGTILIVSIYQ